MKNKVFLGSAVSLLASAGLAWAQHPQAVPTSPALGAGSGQPVPVAVPYGARPAQGAILWQEGMGGHEQAAPASRFWGSAEFLLWKIKDGNIPPLVTAGPAPNGGFLGEPGTVTLLEGEVDYKVRWGGRFTVGYWLDCEQSNGIELSLLRLNDNERRFDAGSDGSPGTAIIARPFFNVGAGVTDVEYVAFPGVLAGRVSVSSESELGGLEGNWVHNLCCHKPYGCETGFRADLIAGLRYLELKENLTISENLTLLAGAPAPFIPGTTILVSDQFETRNRFLGGQIGARAEWWRGRWSLGLVGKLALGVTRQEVSINGTTAFILPGAAPITQPGGLLAQASNAGTRTNDAFSVVPELGVNVGYQVTDSLRAYVGYSFLYWTNVVRPGDQIDLGLNTSQLPTIDGPGVLVGEPRPAPLSRESNFWAQGLTLGLELRF